MKLICILSLSITVLMSSAYAQMLPVLASTVDVVAGRNLRNQGTRFCTITVGTKHAQSASSATAVILLPKNSRLLDTRVISSNKTLASCGRTKILGDNNVVSCKLSRLSPNKEITLRARYHQKILSGKGCSAYIEASHSF